MATTRSLFSPSRSAAAAGNGGASSSRNINLIGTEKDFSVNLNLSVGGSGGAGGDGGAVTINNNGGSILTTSSNSKGVVAQSIGGGGGWGGGAAAAGSGASAAKFTADVSLGGSGGQGNPGGVVTLVNDGVIYTTGSNSTAIYAQSVGGGGGMGGSAATDSSTDGNVQVADYLIGRTGINGDVTQVGDGLWNIQEQFGDAYARLKSLKEIGLAYEELRPEPGSSTWYGKAVSDLTVNVGAGRGGKGGSAGGGGQVTVTTTVSWKRRAPILMAFLPSPSAAAAAMVARRTPRRTRPASTLALRSAAPQVRAARAAT